jgi:hypothetical protein
MNIRTVLSFFVLAMAPFSANASPAPIAAAQLKDYVNAVVQGGGVRA